MNKKALIIVNVGTPAKPSKKHVRKYLFQFLNDKRVIDLPWLLRKLLVNFIIIPFRIKKSTSIYQKLWTEKGSPLLIYQNSLTEKLQAKLKNKFIVFSAMRYGTPSLKNVLQKIKKDNFEEVVVFPMFPHFASSTTGSIFDFVMKSVRHWETMPSVKFINQFYDNEYFINLFSEKIKSYKPENYDHIIFSYHGLPTRQIKKTHPKFEESNCNCHISMPEHGKMCYKAICYETTRLLVEKLNLKPDKFTTSFQSRLSKGWLSPFTDDVIINLTRKGSKKILIVAPSFVADCLETIVEIGIEYNELFIENGGKKLTLVESLNDSDNWSDVIVRIINE